MLTDRKESMPRQRRFIVVSVDGIEEQVNTHAEACKGAAQAYKQTAAHVTVLMGFQYCAVFSTLYVIDAGGTVWCYVSDHAAIGTPIEVGFTETDGCELRDVTGNDWFSGNRFSEWDAQQVPPLPAHAQVPEAIEWLEQRMQAPNLAVYWPELRKLWEMMHALS